MFLAVIPYISKHIDLLARLMRAEAESEGQQGMLLVGNVGVNRVRASCLDFVNIRNLEDMVFQSPGGFEATQMSYFYQPAREVDRRLARRSINGERHVPATTALWFYNPFDQSCRAQWWGQWNSGRFKSHCFYSPLPSENCY
ncbi:MAG: cell wall hydrolase [Haloplasmataceae bacterium]|jgi:N-acetylmuramoyl-L-alanine amidase|nr:cell wall hydrolase [Haloplasmataceae bacterium]